MKKSEKQGDTLDMFSDSLQLGKQLRMTKQEKCGQADKGEGVGKQVFFCRCPLWMTPYGLTDSNFPATSTRTSHHSL